MDRWATEGVPGAGRTSATPTFYTVRETAALLRLDESTLYRHLRAGDFPGLRIGGRYVIPRAALDKLTAEVIATGQCVDLAAWAARWRVEQARLIATASPAGTAVAGQGGAA